MDGPGLDDLLGELEATYEWRDDAPVLVRDLLDLLDRLPRDPGAERWRSRLVLLSLDDLVRDRGAAGAAVAVAEIRERAAARGDAGLQARAERALSNVLSKVGDRSAALEHAVAALALDDDDLLPALRCRVRLAMADALDECGSMDGARPRYREALEHAGSVGTPWLSIAVLNNWAYAEMAAEDLGAAAALAERLQALAQERGVGLNLVPAGTIAEILHGAGRSGEAVTMLRRALGGTDRRSVFDLAGAWLILSQIELATGDLDAAGTSLGTAEHLTAAHGLHGLRVEAVGSRAELLAARGDFAGAYETHRRFHEQTLAQGTAATDARAATAHAMLEADQARRESARYRQMSYHDALTGLPNRRRVDEGLDHRLVRRAPLAVAMVDLDHFKTVNDTCSHEAGDAVLVRLARLLEGAAAAVPDAYAARLGGEEFLLVLPGTDLARAHEVAETLRRRVATTDWADIAPGVTVTVSIGLAATAATAATDRLTADRPGLLREADRHLHAAKTGGRNRVEPRADPASSPLAPQAPTTG